jgi:TonB family protein
MKRFLLLAVCSVCALSGGPLAVAQNVAAQAPSSDATPQAVLTKLVPPVYLPLARQARITGDVKVRVLIRKDGSVESAEVISGHPMLKEAALDSAQKSQFECKACEDQGVSYSLTFTFGFGEGGCREVVRERRVRSPKCVYLWKCGLEHSTSWEFEDYRAPEVTQTPGHVTILVSPVCVQTEISRSK